jgi:hypothetical protein
LRIGEEFGRNGKETERGNSRYLINKTERGKKKHN